MCCCICLVEVYVVKKMICLPVIACKWICEDAVDAAT